MVSFLLITGAAESLQVADVVLTAMSKGDNVVNGEVIYVSLTTAFALIAIALKYIFPHLGWNANPGRLTHECFC